MLAQPLAPLDGTSVHVPSDAPFAFWQRPPQHSASVTHESPEIVQNEGALSQIPFKQYFEQQSPFAPHVLPEVLQFALSARHEPPSHTPPQHSPSFEHDVPSLLH